MHILFEKDWNTTAKKIVALIKRQRRDDMDIIKTRAYYEQIKGSDLCSCDYCRNYISEINDNIYRIGLVFKIIKIIYAKYYRDLSS